MTAIDELDIVIRRKNSKFVATIPQLQLYASGADISAALERLEQRKLALIEDLREAGELENLEIPQPSPVNRSGSSSTDLTRFAIKTAVVACLIAVAVGVPGLILISKAEKFVDRTLVIAQSERQKISEQLNQYAMVVSEQLNQYAMVVSEKLDQYTKVGGANFWGRVDVALDRAADPKNAMPEEKKQQLLSNIRAVVTKWRPFVTEAGTLFTPPDNKKR
jgi:predicted RNase H-like HicB family nuclease